MRILHILNCLDPGGAEIMMARLLAAADRDAFQFHVVSLTDLGAVAESLTERQIPVTALGMGRGGLPSLYGPLRELRRVMDDFAPDLVQTWLYHANLVGGLVNRAGRRRPLIWSIRQTNIDVESIGWRTAMVARSGAPASYIFPDRILYNATVSRHRHEAAGYRAGLGEVIPNGFDTTALSPSQTLRDAVRGELGIAPDEPLIGMIARFDPQKDHANFIAAAGQVAAECAEARFVLAGQGVDRANAALAAAVDAAGLDGRIRLLGHRDDVGRLLNGLDIACLTSTGEGFPNAIGEAMAMAVPCIATDVGDCAVLLGDSGRIVPPRQPEAVAQAMLQLLRMSAAERRELGARARQRIVDRFAISAIARRYETTWRSVADAAIS